MQNRTCRACEGTGNGADGPFAPNGCYLGPSCEPCHGEGVVSERIPASDAIADAETLRSLAFTCDLVPGAWTIFYAAGSSAERASIGAHVCAKYAARHAYVLIPGLRG